MFVPLVLLSSLCSNTIEIPADVSDSSSSPCSCLISVEVNAPTGASAVPAFLEASHSGLNIIWYPAVVFTASPAGPYTGLYFNVAIGAI